MPNPTMINNNKIMYHNQDKLLQKCKVVSAFKKIY